MIRIGAVEYLNTKPLVYRLAEQHPDLEVSFDLPSRLADRLHRDELDVALIPCVEYLARPGYQIVGDAAIACRGPVWSVRLMSRVPMAQIKSLALDVGSRTSAILAQWLLWDQHGLRPRVIPLPMEAAPEDVAADAILLIGDRAMHPARGEYAEIWDLGDRWCRRTELPFVFAMWVGRADRSLEHVAKWLGQARDLGLDHLEEISQHEAGPVGLTTADCLTYFAHHLYFRLGPRELAGLRHFASRAAAIGLLPSEAQSRVPHTPQLT